MADKLIFENENGDPINEVVFRRTIKGIPSLITKFYCRNESDRVSFRGRINVAPASGNSYSEDLAISTTGDNWSRYVEIDIPVLTRHEFRLRVVPVATPAPSTGRSSVTVTGKFY